MGHIVRPLREKPTPLKNDENQWFRCPNCGFINKWDRTTTPQRKSIAVYDETIPSDLLYADEIDKICTVDMPHDIGNIMKNIQDGNPPDTYYGPKYYEAHAGCSFCGQVWLER